MNNSTTLKTNKVDFIPESITKREYFVAMAMQGLCANSIPGAHHGYDFLAKEAVMYAYATIGEMEKAEQQRTNP